MFWTRLISGIVVLAILLLTICLGGPVLFVFLLLISLIGMFELYRACALRKDRENALTVTAYLGAAVYYAAMYFGGREMLLPVLSIVLAVLLAVYVFTFPRFQSGEVMTAFFGIVYVAVCLSYIYQTRNLPDGEFSVWLIVICSWGCDTMAYVCGRLFGRHKMTPHLSPKKTVEGAVGGVVSAAVFGAIYALAVGRFLSFVQHPVFPFMLICAVGALISMVGDLAASAIKRNHDIKDYGKLIPGHGGILDRFDSIIITAPVIFFLAEIFSR